MAEQLKHFFNEQLVRSIASELARVHRPFRQDLFVGACMSGLADLELTGRGWRIADAL